METTRLRTRSSTGDELDDIRRAIDAMDEDLVDIVRRRVELARSAAGVKQREGLPLRDLRREAELVRRAAELARAHGIDPEPVRDIFWSVIALSHRSIGSSGGVT